MRQILSSIMQPSVSNYLTTDRGQIFDKNTHGLSLLAHLSLPIAASTTLRTWKQCSELQQILDVVIGPLRKCIGVDIPAIETDLHGEIALKTGLLQRTD